MTKHKQLRLEWAKVHNNWTTEPCEKVLRTYESKFQIFDSNKRGFVRRSEEERTLDICTVWIVKHGGRSVMVWRCFDSARASDLA